MRWKCLILEPFLLEPGGAPPLSAPLARRASLDPVVSVQAVHIKHDRAGLMCSAPALLACSH